MQIKSLKNDEYPPSEDTFFIVDNIENEKGDFALDIGSGSGYLTKLLSENFLFVVGTDINYVVLKHQKVSVLAFQRDKETYYVSISGKEKELNKIIPKIKKLI